MVKRNSPLALVDVRFHADDDSVQIGWIQKTDIDPEHIYYQYNVTLNGKPVILNGNTVDMTGKEVLDAYLIDESGKGKIYNVPNLLNEWEPIKYKAMSMPNSFNIKHIIPYCSKNYQYDVNSKNINLPLIYPKVASSIFFEDVEKTIIETGKDTIILQANVNRSYPVNKVKFLVDKENINFVKLIWKDNICKVIPTNHSDETREVIIYATTESGLKAARKIIVKPPTLPAPTFIREPKIVRKGNELIVDYKLDLQGGTRDESEIMWLREDKIYEDSDSVLRILLPIFISRNENRAKIYPLTKADADKRISVIVTPKSNRSEYGFLDMTSITIPEKYKSKLSENINTDFSNFPDKGFSNHYLKLNLPPKKGFWTITEHRPEGEFAEWKATNDSISPWSYGFGFDGAANAEGLYQNRRGARLVYTPVEDSYGDMSLTTVLAPCKSAGQGFGSATGQYLDIYIKYDTETMTGYGLRIVRTPDNDRSVNMVLMQYEKGVAKPISESITTSVYRTNCTVSLSVKGDTLTATAITDAVYTDNRPNVARVVGAENFPPLQAKITPNKFGGIGFQHTGTGNTNATVITHLKVDFGK
jgi:hypothetical protein